MTADIHTCSYQCDRPACIRAQRDDLAARAEETAAEIGRLRGELEQARNSCQAMVHQSYKDGFADGIAPAEAKGEAVAWRNPTPYGVGYSFASEEVMRDLVGYVAESFDTPQPAGGEAVALYGMFRALVDAGGAATVARHGAMPRPEALTEALQRGMLAIEHMFHPERFDDFPGTTPPAAQVQQGRPRFDGFNELPQAARDYIMWLETDADPAGTIQQNYRLTMENRGLRAMFAEATHPAAGDKVRELVTKWRSDADDDMRMNLPLAASVASACADELEAALAQAPAVRGDAQ